MGLKTLINPFSNTWNHLESPTLYVPINVIPCSTKVVEHASFFMLFFFSLDYPFASLKMCLVVQGARTQHLGTAHTHLGCCYAWFGLVMSVDHKAKLAYIRTWVQSVCVCLANMHLFSQEKRWIGSKAKPPCIITWVLQSVCVCVSGQHPSFRPFFLDSLEVGGRWSRWHCNGDPIWIRVVGGAQEARGSALLMHSFFCSPPHFPGLRGLLGFLRSGSPFGEPLSFFLMWWSKWCHCGGWWAQ